MFYGRAFILYGPTPRRTWLERLLRRPERPRPTLGLVLPCEFCGTPVWPGHEGRHMCHGLNGALEAEFDRRVRDGH